jgi:hypothetical protein
MSTGYQLIAASFALSSIGEVIKYQDAKKKEKRMASLNDKMVQAEQASLLYSRQIQEDKIISQNRINRSTAARIAGARNVDTESGAMKIEQAGRESSLLGALDDLDTQVSMETTNIGLRSEAANISSQTPKLSSLLGLGATSVGSDVLASEGLYELRSGKTG